MIDDHQPNHHTDERPPWRRPPSAAQRGRAEVDAAIQARRREDPYAEGEAQNAEQDTALRWPDPGALLVNGMDLHPEPVRWLWPGWLALGKLHILAGAPGQGKTTIAMALAATVSRAQVWPDGSHCMAPGNILVWSGEDDPGDTLLPRLIAAGADRERCYFVHGTRRADGRVHPFDPATDMALLLQKAQQIGGVRLLVVDPVVSAVAGDSHKNGDVRRALQPLVDLARALDAAVLGISHFSKAGGSGADPVSRVVGSIAFTAVARVLMIAASVRGGGGGGLPGPDGVPATRRIFARGKSNIGPDDGGFEYQIEQLDALPGLPDVPASRIVWGQAVSGSARELLAEADDSSDEGAAGRKSAMEAAQDFLREFLGDDQVPVKSVMAEADKAGVSWASLRRASEHLCVIKSRGGVSGQSFWKLPKKLS